MGHFDRGFPFARVPGEENAGRKRRASRSSIPWFLLALLCLTQSAGSRADTISGTVKDPSGAVVALARIEISGGSLAQAIVLSSDSEGKFAAPDLAPGKYSVKVSKDGFEDSIATLDLKGRADLPVNLVILSQLTSISVSGKAAAFANSDPLYRQLSLRKREDTDGRGNVRVQVRNHRAAERRRPLRNRRRICRAGALHPETLAALRQGRAEAAIGKRSPRSGFRRGGIPFQRKSVYAVLGGARPAGGNTEGSRRSVRALEKPDAAPARSTGRVYAIDPRGRHHRQRRCRRPGGRLQPETPAFFQRLHDRKGAQGPALFHTYGGRSDPADRFAGGGRAHQQRRRWDGRRHLVLAAPRRGAESALRELHGRPAAF